ncbi:unnamed protein product [Linum trigynum]|uniref:Uncharacterized protein n=1 Tax=Linum trigynum TaxID=586398 RepID=A0AAV2GTE5_9ROSI
MQGGFTLSARNRATMVTIPTNSTPLAFPSSDRKPICALCRSVRARRFRSGVPCRSNFSNNSGVPGPKDDDQEQGLPQEAV